MIGTTSVVLADALTSGPSTLVQVLRWRGEHQADRRAFTFGHGNGDDEVDVTYAALDRRARAIAALLQQETEPGDRALLLYQPGLEYVAAFLGCLYAAVVAVPVYRPNPRQERTLSRLRAIVRDAGPTVVLTTNANLPISGRLVDIDLDSAVLETHDIYFTDYERQRPSRLRQGVRLAVRTNPNKPTVVAAGPRTEPDTAADLGPTIAGRTPSPGTAIADVKRSLVVDRAFADTSRDLRPSPDDAYEAMVESNGWIPAVEDPNRRLTMKGKTYGLYAVALAIVVVGALWAGVPVGTLTISGLILACPLMMFYMMRAMHGGGMSGGGGHDQYDSPRQPRDKNHHHSLR